MFITKKQKKNDQGFTLIELLVSLALFAIVLVMILGSILSIVDANRKARSLMTVMNNLNFAVDSMTRSFKTGDVNEIVDGGDSNSYKCFKTLEINYRLTSSSISPDKRSVEYCWDESTGELKKNVSGSITSLTSPDIHIDYARFEVLKDSDNYQPRLLINLQGTVSIGGQVSSSFSIQTTVDQRKLDL